MWKPFKCRLFRDHDYDTRRQPGVMFLECRRCGHRSHGWVLDEMRVRRQASPLRLLIAEPRHAQTIRPMDKAEAVQRVTSADMAVPRLTFADFRRGPVLSAPAEAVKDSELGMWG